MVKLLKADNTAVDLPKTEQASATVVEDDLTKNSTYSIMSEK